MADTGPITIAFAGAGETTEANVEALLNDFLGFGEEGDDGYYVDSPREEINVFFPASKAHSNKQLDKVVAWTAKANLPFFVAVDEKDNEKPDRKMKSTLADAEEVKEVSDVNAELVEVLKATEGEAYLVLLFGTDEETPSDATYDLLEAAADAGIAIKDLTAGLDDIKVTEEGDAVVEDAPEPEPEPEKPARRRRGKAVQEEQAVTEKPLVDADTARANAAEAKEKAAVDKKAARAKVDADLAAKKTPDLPHDRQSESALDGGVLVAVADLEGVAVALEWAVAHLSSVDRANAAVNLAEEIQYRPLTVAVNDALNWVASTLGTPPEATGSTESDEQAESVPEAQDAPAAPRKSRGRPRADGTPAQPKDPNEPTITVFEDEDGNLTKAGRGRPPKGQKRTKISEAQAQEAGLI